MNNAVFTGKLIDDASLHVMPDSGRAVSFLEFDVRVKNKRNLKRPLLVKCISHDRQFHTDIVLEKLKKNMKVTVSGEVYIHQWEQNDYVYSCFYLELLSMDIHYEPIFDSKHPQQCPPELAHAVVSDLKDDVECIDDEKGDLNEDINEIGDIQNYLDNNDGVTDDVSKIDF